MILAERPKILYDGRKVVSDPGTPQVRNADGVIVMDAEIVGIYPPRLGCPDALAVRFGSGQTANVEITHGHITSMDISIGDRMLIFRPATQSKPVAAELKCAPTYPVPGTTASSTEHFIQAAPDKPPTGLFAPERAQPHYTSASPTEVVHVPDRNGGWQIYDGGKTHQIGPAPGRQTIGTPTTSIPVEPKPHHRPTSWWRFW